MDKVQIYTCCLLAFGVINDLIRHGDPKEGQHDFRIAFAALIIGLPYWGRIFGWW